MKHFTHLFLLLLINTTLTFASEPVVNANPKLTTSFLIKEMQEKATLSTEQQTRIEEAFTNYALSREKIFKEARQLSEKVDFEALTRIQQTYKQAEASILTPEQSARLNTPTEERQLSGTSGEINESAAWSYSGTVFYTDTIRTRGTVSLPYCDALGYQTIGYYIDLRENCELKIDWNLDLGPEDYIEIYTMDGFWDWVECLRTIQRPSSAQRLQQGTVTTNIANGRAYIYIHTQVIYGDEDMQYCRYAPLQFTIKPNPSVDGDFSVSGNSVFGGNVGIGITDPAEALDMKGILQLRTPNTSDPDLHFKLSVPNTSYANLSTNSNSFLFNKAVLALNGEFGTYGEHNLYFLINQRRQISVLSSNGNVGIGTDAPKARLHVNGDMVVDQKIGTADAKNLLFHTNGYTKMTIVNSSGNVGIGVTNPSHRLEVDGAIRAEEIVITTNGADFVFEEGYRLPSLHEVEKHIETKKHLPGIPSAAEMQENGVGVSELQTKLLQKIEELTLYVIRQQKIIEELEKKVNNQNQ